MASEKDVIKLIILHENYKFIMKIKRNAPLKILMNAFCKRTGLVADNLRFLADCQRIQKRDTAEKLGLTDGDYIETFQSQDGG